MSLPEFVFHGLPLSLLRCAALVVYPFGPWASWVAELTSAPWCLEVKSWAGTRAGDQTDPSPQTWLVRNHKYSPDPPPPPTHTHTLKNLHIERLRNRTRNEVLNVRQKHSSRHHYVVQIICSDCEINIFCVTHYIFLLFFISPLLSWEYLAGNVLLIDH